MAADLMNLIYAMADKFQAANVQKPNCVFINMDHLEKLKDEFDELSSGLSKVKDLDYVCGMKVFVGNVKNPSVALIDFY